ncbi:anaerobic sulfite reductase subunit A [Gottschalkia purinilytica]|uniref:Anaerobic sulfite reductase subunit A n=1 Tax=Gottschalkia purinilytica TaxID=1503 RepID=A0A0L0W7W0_GOTPU|nr:anaerobic sulfite reductase subunit AsrA [Gottschalkia purinilytica]KNF07663.1 anaerobic sulfite reductase subunit A [Gottschalkia purinilytica]
MAFSIPNKKIDEIFEIMQKEYEIWGPKRFPSRGRFSDDDLIIYDKIQSIDELEVKEKSEGSPKEPYFPITQTMFYFNEKGYEVPDITDKKLLIFARPCDINAIERLDNIYLKNGGYEDFYYKRLREKVKFALIECSDGFENCFCVSMGSNKTDNYSLAFRFLDEKVFVKVKDDEFKNYFLGKEIKFEPKFIEENKVKVVVPEIKDMPMEIFNHPIWKQYERCVACGRCSTSCPICSCFTTSDLFYDENPKVGERRRVWTSCHIDGFTNMAGGHEFRKEHADRMRFKTLHKIYDYKKRFNKNHMCVGCGRCDDRCPEYISFSCAINSLGKILKEEF